MSDPTQPVPLDAEVLVIGAGVAGLCAAQELRRNGHQVLVLEARSRPGGRIHTVDGIDLGAHWIHGTEGNPLTNFARERRLPIVYVGGDSTYTGGWEALELRQRGAVLDADGKSDLLDAGDELLERLDRVRRELERDDRDCSVAEALHRAGSGGEGSGAIDAAARWHVVALARDDFGADLEQLSARAWDEGFELFGYGDSVWLDGFASLIEALSDGIEVRLQHVVRRVVQHAAYIAVELADGQMLRARHVLVGVPLGVLKAASVEFEPPLPAVQQAAIAALGVGHLAKVVLHFDAVHWPRDQYAFGLPAAGVVPSPSFIVNLWPVYARPALVLLIGGQAAAAIERLSEAERHAWAMAVLAEAFGPGMPAPRAIETTRWSAEPESLGAYCYIPVGTRAAVLDAFVQARHGSAGSTLGFVGEHTHSAHWGTVHGAWLSGLREAARISGKPALPRNVFHTENRRWRAQQSRAARFFNQKRRELQPEERATRLLLLDRCAVFGSVMGPEREVLAAMLEPRTLDDGEFLCRQGNTASEVFLLAQGCLEVTRADGTPLHRLAAGEVLGELALFTDARRNADVRACGAVRLYVLDYQRFRRFLHAFPLAFEQLMRAALRRVLP